MDMVQTDWGGVISSKGPGWGTVIRSRPSAQNRRLLAASSHRMGRLDEWTAVLHVSLAGPMAPYLVKTGGVIDRPGGNRMSEGILEDTNDQRVGGPYAARN